jgi:chemotaxis protein MotB
MAMSTKEPEAPNEDWLTTYADAITLLMAFFVMLLNFSKINIPMFEEVAAGIKDEIGTGEPQVTPTQMMKIDVQDVVYSMQADEVVNVDTDDQGIVIELASSAFYKPGSADIRPEALPVLQKMGQTLESPRYKTYVVEVEGYTDDDPIHTARYPSNWELSAGRATGVVRLFIEQGMDTARLKASGFAETRPKVPNRDASGAPVRENQAINRRVLIRVYPMSLDERKERLERIEIEQLISEEKESPDAQTEGGTTDQRTQ